MHLIECVEIYISDQIEKAAEAISITVQEKISDGDVLLTFGCSSLIQHILTEAKANNRKFRVIVVDARPCHEGLEMLRRLVNKDIHCTCIQINAVGFIMPEVNILFDINRILFILHHPSLKLILFGILGN